MKLIITENSSKMVDKLYHIDSILCLSQTQESFWNKCVFGSVSVGKGASFLVEEIRVSVVAM